jgi:glycosyltransferase involved in cell wall biosynthesis
MVFAQRRLANGHRENNRRSRSHMILLSHPTGNTFVRALLAALLEAGKLGLFATTIAVDGNEWWLKVLPEKVRTELLRRKFEAPKEKLFTKPSLEFMRLIAQRLGFSPVTAHEKGFACVDAVYRDLDRAVARILSKNKSLKAVYAYEDGALASFRAARDLGVKRFYELPIAYWETSRRLLAEEAERWPRWKQTLPGVFDSDEKLNRKTEEIELAQVVICPSRFVLNSLPEKIHASKKCVVAEFGSPASTTAPSFRPAGKKLRVIFVGSMSQRKGLADLFAAMKILKSREVEFVVLGSPLAPMEFYRSEFPDFIYEPTGPHHEALRLMGAADVLVLPSIVEGRALVQQEAMSQGIPIIATANAGGEDLIEEGVTGFLVPIRSPQALADRIDWLAQNRDRLPEMKRAAYEKSRALTWDRYGKIILDAIEHA